MMSVFKEHRVGDEEQVAEGDAVVARFNYVVTLHDGRSSLMARSGCRAQCGRFRAL